jgi:hypothetical protein
MYTFGGHKNDVRRLRKVGSNVRWVTDCQAVTSAQADNWIAKTHRQNQNALRFERFGFANACSAPLFSACSARRKHNRPAVGCPPYVCLITFSAPAVGYADVGVLVMPVRFTLLWDEGKPRPYDANAICYCAVVYFALCGCLFCVVYGADFFSRGFK